MSHYTGIQWTSLISTVIYVLLPGELSLRTLSTEVPKEADNWGTSLMLYKHGNLAESDMLTRPAGGLAEAGQ